MIEYLLNGRGPLVYDVVHVGTLSNARVVEGAPFKMYETDNY